MDPIMLEVLKANGPMSLIVIIGMILFKKMLANDRSEIESATKSIRDDLKENTKSNQTLSMAVVKLEYQVEALNKIIPRLEKTEKDLNEAFSQLREMRGHDL